MWVIYRSPADFPGKTVARRFEVRDQNTATEDLLEGELADLRKRFQSMGLVNIGRMPQDDFCIVEVWS